MDKFLLKLAAMLAPLIAEKIMAILPVIIAAAAKVVVDQIFSRFPSLEDIPGVDMPLVAEQIRETVNQLPDIDIPIVSEVFDLSEWLKGRGL